MHFFWLHSDDVCDGGEAEKSLTLEPDPGLGTVDPPLTPLIQAPPEWMIFGPMKRLNGSKTSEQNMQKYFTHS